MTSNTKHHRFFIDQELKNTDEVVITDPAVLHQMRNVLRFRTGDPIILLDGTGAILHGKVKELQKNDVVVLKEKFERQVIEKEIIINLYFSMIKKDKAEWVLQKCTELGVSSFHPVISTRTEKTGLDMERAERIIREAAEQSHRLDLPAIGELIELNEAVKICNNNCIYLGIGGEKLDVLEYKEEVNIFVGPEGGFSEEDVQLFEENKIKKLGLGDQVLRAETASVAVSSLFLLS